MNVLLQFLFTVFLFARFTLQRPYLSMRACRVIEMVEVGQEQGFPTLFRFLPVS